MSSELVAVELQLKGYDGVMSDMRALDQMLNSFRGSKNKLELQTNLAQTKKEVLALQGEMNRLNSIKLKLDEQGKSSEGLNNKLKETRERLRDAQQAVKEFQYALKNLTSTTFKQSFNTISSWAAHWGSAMQSMGNALTRLTSPFANFTKGMVMGAGYQALGKFTEGLTSAFSRADTMRKYPRVMEAMGYSADEAQASINRLDEAVQGLPTKLDDIVGMAQRFTSTVGDMNKGTDIAIAANNAFLASMSTETQKYQGMMQLQDVIGGKNMNAREWQALANSMMPAIRMMGESLGKTGKELDEYVAQVQQGKIANKEFLDTLVKAGTDENGKIRKIAMESLDTWEAFFSRIGTAASRLGYKGIIEPLNEIVDTVTNGKFKSVNLLLDDFVIHGIDNMTNSIKDWVKAHPQEITDFFKSLKSVNWGSIAKGFGQGMLEIANLVQRFSEAFGGRDLSRIGRWMIRGNILGNALTIAGGLIKGSRGLIAGVGATIVKGARTFKNIRRLGGITGWLKTLTLGDGNTGKQALDTVAQASPKMGKFSLGVSKLFKGWAEVATIIGGSAFVAWGSMKLIKGAVKSFKGTVDILNDVDWDMGKKALLGIGGFLTAMGGLSVLAGKNLGVGIDALFGEAIVGAFTTLATGIADVDMFLIKRTMKHLADATDYLNEAIDNLNNVKSVGNVKDKVGNAIDALNEITKLLKPKRTDKQTVSGGIEGLGKNVVNSLTNIKDSLGTIKESVGIINELNKIKLEDNNIEDLTSRIGTAMGFISGMFDRMPESMKSGKSSETSGNMKTSLSNFNSSLNSIIGENGILKRIPQILKEMTSLISDGKLSVFETQMARIGDVLTNVFNSLQGIGNGEYFSSNIDGFRTGLKSLKFAIKHLQEISGMEVGNDVVGKIKSIISNIESAFDVGAIGRIQENISTMVTSIKDALKAFEELNGDIEVDVNIKLSSGFDTSVNNVIKKIKDGKDKIKKQNKGISISIPVSVHFSVSSNFGAAIGRIRAWGAQLANAQRGQHPITNGPGQSGGGLRTRNGVLYRSGGGSAFRPRGTDKIPSMLTEGEYVHKKQAVDFFGLDFMRSVNNMDVRGAMNALLTKAGTSVGVGRQSIINHTINNNQRVNMNVTTNNPNFAGARMGRFVGAL